MPRGGDDLASTDEVKVYKDEGDDENRASQNLSEDKRELVIETEEGKESDLETGRFLHNDKTAEGRSYFGSGTASDYLFSGRLSFGYPLITPYPYPGSAASAAASFGLSGVPPFYMYNNDLFAHPPPAHMRLAASLHLPPHPGLPGGPCTPSMYGLPPSAAAMAAAAAAAAGSAAHSPSSAAAAAAMYGFPGPASPHASHLAAHHPFYSTPDLPPWPGSMAFGSPYSPYHQLSRLGSLGSMHPGISYPGVSRPALVTSGPTTQEPSPPRSISDYTSSNDRLHSSSIFSHKRHLSAEHRAPPSASASSSRAAASQSNSHHSATSSALRHHHNHHRVPSTVSVPPPPASASIASPSSLSPSTSSSAATTYRRHHGSSSASSNAMSHVKKPLNAFMLFMKEMRQKVIEECTLKESAAINQILGRKWHSLDRAEQARYYDLARREKELHRKRYPMWSARDNYALHSRKRRKRLDHRPIFRRDGLGDDDTDGNNAAKKCRARYGLDQQSQWCKPCRRKKRCIRFVADGENENGGNSSDEVDNVTTLSGSVPPAADSTTELFSPMPLSSASSSNTDDLSAIPGSNSNSVNGMAATIRHHEQVSRTVVDASVISRTSLCLGGPSRLSSNVNSGLISSTIV